MLTLGALAGLVSIVFFVAGLAFGITPLIFKSGSMSPTIDTGALAFARTVPASEVQVGDIVSVYDSQGVRITHRVETIEQQGNNLAIAELRGDANSVSDPDPYVITEADRVLFSVNRLGYVAVWLSGSSGFVLGTIAICGLVYVAFRPQRTGPRSGDDAPDTATEGTLAKHPRNARGDSHALKSIVVLATVGLSVAGATNVGGTQAAFTGMATAGTAQFQTAATFPAPAVAPTSVSCATVGFLVATGVDISWPAVSGNSYRLIVRNPTTNAILGSNDYTASSTVGTVRYGSPNGMTVPFNLIAGLYNVEVHGLSGSNVTTDYAGFQFGILLTLLYSCNQAIPYTAGAAAARIAASPPAPETTTPSGTATTSVTSPAPTVTTEPSASPTSRTATPTGSTAPSTITSSPPITTPSTTTTTTTTVPPITTTPSEVPVGAPVTTPGLSAQKLSTTSGTVVSVSNSSGTEVYRGTVDSDAVLHWLTGTDQLYVITTSGVSVIDSSTGVWAESPAPSELPDEIKALVP
ncbi:signal peptidase I [Rhodococcus sp. NPDC059969]|uniref:signal peptidase I n=1 Tax=Rhodococcus sp. NPDC059969 TaxID=3347018 RepID=UPI00366C4872